MAFEPSPWNSTSPIFMLSCSAAAIWRERIIVLCSRAIASCHFIMSAGRALRYIFLNSYVVGSMRSLLSWFAMIGPARVMIPTSYPFCASTTTMSPIFRFCSDVLRNISFLVFLNLTSNRSFKSSWVIPSSQLKTPSLQQPLLYVQFISPDSLISFSHPLWQSYSLIVPIAIYCSICDCINRKK